MGRLHEGVAGGWASAEAGDEAGGQQVREIAVDGVVRQAGEGLVVGAGQGRMPGEGGQEGGLAGHEAAQVASRGRPLPNPLPRWERVGERAGGFDALDAVVNAQKAAEGVQGGDDLGGGRASGQQGVYLDASEGDFLGQRRVSGGLEEGTGTVVERGS